MGLQPYDCCLLSTAIFFIVIDIILALCLRLVVPRHVSETGYYPANGQKLQYEEAVAICPCLERIFPDGTKDPIAFDKVSSKSIDKRSIPAQPQSSENKYPYLVSLSIPAYSDDLDQKIFACNGIIQSTDWLVTSKSCVQEESEWLFLTVRSESPFWSQYGRVHHVIDFKKGDFDGLMLLKVWPSFSEALVPYPKIQYPSDVVNWTYAVSLGWEDGMYKKKLPYRFKYKQFEIEEWTSKLSESESAEVCYNETESCSSISSKLLLTSCHQVIGMKSGSCDGFSKLRNEDNVNSYEDIKCYKIYKDEHVHQDVEVCQS